MLEVTVCLSVQECILHSKAVEELRENDSSNRVYRVNANTEFPLLDSLNIHEL